jgi:hypothetical protein
MLFKHELPPLSTLPGMDARPTWLGTFKVFLDGFKLFITIQPNSVPANFYCDWLRDATFLLKLLDACSCAIDYGTNLGDGEMIFEIIWLPS